MAIPPLVYMQTAGARSLHIPVKVPGGAPFNCRFSTVYDSGYAGSSAVILNGAAPTIANVSDGCLLSWDTQGAVPGSSFAVSIAVETGSGAALATSFADFLVNFVSSPVPDCSGSGVFAVDVGSTLMLPFQATSPSGTLLTVESIGLLGALSPAEGSSGPEPLATSLFFSPENADIGVRALNVVYRDELGVDGSCAAVIDVGPCPEQGQPCTEGEGACLATGTSHCDFGIVYCDARPGLPTKELCNGIDDDCDSIVDDDVCGTSSTGTIGDGGAGGADLENGGGGAGAAEEQGGPSSVRIDGCGCGVTPTQGAKSFGALVVCALAAAWRKRSQRQSARRRNNYGKRWGGACDG